ncbi:hypothetical protein FQN51_008748 [Onygenales sp. PD_10]|nr:hypothetical protein FQN51_008748 [Onygenales sp. PD_10]
MRRLWKRETLRPVDLKILMIILLEGISQDSLLKELPRAIFAAFDSYTASTESTSLHRTCLEGTRVSTLNLIEKWSQSIGEYECIFWLKGMAGAGKSTIARTLTEVLPDLRPHVSAAIDRKRDFGGKRLSEQWEH